MPNATVNGVDLYYEVHGEGEPLLLIAGLASDSQSWLPIVDKLSKYYTLIMPDNRGVGRTKPQAAETGIQQITDDCISLLHFLEIPSTHIPGHSMGGFAALDCAIRYPEHVSKLILAGTSAFSSQRDNFLFHDWCTCLESGMNPELWFRSVFYWIFTKAFFEDKDILRNAVQSAIEYPCPQTAVAFRNQVNAIREFNCLKNLKDITSKTLAVFGKEDLLFPPDENAPLLSAIPDAFVSIVDQAAHSIHMERPVEFVEIIKNFLAGN